MTKSCLRVGIRPMPARWVYSSAVYAVDPSQPSAQRLERLLGSLGSGAPLSVTPPTSRRETNLMTNVAARRLL